MAAPVAAFIQLPTDAVNTGKNVRSETRVVGADTVHEHFFVPASARSILGKYKASTGTLTVPTAITNGTTTGFAWLYNPVGSAVKMAINRVSWNCQIVALAVDLLGGEFRASLNTFTGVGAGTLVTPAKRDSTDAAAVGNLRLASTGLTVTLGATIQGNQYPVMGLATGGAGVWPSYYDKWEPDNEAEQIVLRAGEGISFWHAIAVTTANRRLFLNVAWEEFE